MKKWAWSPRQPRACAAVGAPASKWVLDCYVVLSEFCFCGNCCGLELGFCFLVLDESGLFWLFGIFYQGLQHNCICNAIECHAFLKRIGQSLQVTYGSYVDGSIIIVVLLQHVLVLKGRISPALISISVISQLIMDSVMFQVSSECAQGAQLLSCFSFILGMWFETACGNSGCTWIVAF